MTTVAEAHEAASHHEEDPAVVQHRQRMGVWLFIAGDVIIWGALAFTYLYLRGVDTEHGWRSIRAFLFNDFTPAQALHMINFQPIPYLHEQTVSVAYTWAIVAVVVISGLLFWFAENRLRLPRAKVSKFIPVAVVASLVALAGCVVETFQIRNIPSYFQIQNDSQLFVHTAYGSAMIAFGVGLIIHLVILAFLGVGLAVRAAHGKVSRTQWFQVQLVKYLWTWVCISTVLTAIITETLH